MNLEEIQAARDRERQTDKLQQLRETFYADAGEFIQQLRTERDRAAERADDPFDAPEVNQLTDEINTAEQTVEAIYEKRVGKIVKAASFAAADLPAEADGMTAEEQDLFDTLVGNIKDNRTHVLNVLAGDDEPGDMASSDEPQSSAETVQPDVSAADLMGSGAETATEATPESVPPDASGTDHPAQRDSDPGVPPESNATDSTLSNASESAASSASGTAQSQGPPQHGDGLRNDGGQPSREGEPSPPGQDSQPATGPGESDRSPIDRRTVRITDDIETFVGSDDRDYDLERDDVVTLPESNASLLVERDAATEL